MSGEFFIAGGDAAGGFQTGEEVFYSVAFAIGVLVKGRFYRSAVAYGYDGAATEWVHISTDGVAVVVLVHNRVTLMVEAGGRDRFTLIVVGDVGAGERKAQRIAHCVTG